MKTRRTYVKNTPPSNPTPDEVARVRAARGARLLDAEVPGWADVIDLDALDVGEMEVAEAGDLAAVGGCVLCQVDLAITTGKETSAGCRIPRPGETDADVYAEAQFYERQRRAVADLEGDPTDDEGDRVQGSYRRLAMDLHLYDDELKTAHGFLADSATTYPALDAAWTAEVEARRSDGRSTSPA